MVWVHFNIKRIMKQNALERVREQEFNVQTKKQLAIERRNKVISIIHGAVSINCTVFRLWRRFDKTQL